VLNSAAAAVDEEQLAIGDGKLHVVATTRTPLKNENGDVSHLICVSQALLHAGKANGREAVEREVEQATSRLRAAQAEVLSKERLMILGQLASSLAHQIRNPLGAISNALALLRRQLDSSSSPLVEEALAIAQEEIWVANRIISDLLEYSRIQPPARNSVSLSEIIDRAVLAEKVPDSIKVEQNVSDAMAVVDEKQLCVAISKLIRNACEAMESGGGTLTFTAEPRGKRMELVIADTGIGVRQEAVGLLFEPLITSKPLGIGLGLTTARALVINQGGTLECESELGKGARFILSLPVVGPSETDRPYKE
jgi:signal transduction histidine kinase